MEHPIHTVTTADYQEIIELWEASVRATHHFLNEEWIAEHRPLILNQYLDMVDLRCIRNGQSKILGFSGTAEGNVEMLFVHPDSFGKGVGGALMKNAIESQGATKVDVNEDNPQACGFYKSLGFEVTDRSALDGQGNPFPILHMTLKTQ
ncbi:MAG: GNAT family N-acetyltransferase [Roseivirga sp.]|nr:GNAT family N-acetyltransferase [Roseivirga sp.]